MSSPNVFSSELINLNLELINKAINSWHPFWALPSDAVDFMKHLRCCRRDNEPVDRKFWQIALISILQDERFHLSLITGEILHTYISPIPEGLIECPGCGDRWDGCRQCDCPQMYEMMELYPEDYKN